jgi:outer membrane protein assembly factor BamB
MIATNWSEHPPRQLWKVPVGPGWSSFAVAGNLLFTQEQRGPMETVVCYDASSGREIWNRQYEARLEDPMGGPGPRATPTLANGGLFVTGSDGNVPSTESRDRRRGVAEEFEGSRQPGSADVGLCSSPLVIGSNVIVWAGGKDGKGPAGIRCRDRRAPVVGGDGRSYLRIAAIEHHRWRRVGAACFPMTDWCWWNRRRARCG